MMSTRGRQDVEKYIVNPLSLEQRIRRDINRAQRTRDSLAYVMSLKLISDKKDTKTPNVFEQLMMMQVRHMLEARRKSLTSKN